MGEGRGKSESRWLPLRRCLAIIRRVQQGPAERDRLIEAVLNEVGPDAYGEVDDQALHKRFHNDIERIRNHLYIDIRADPGTREYHLQDNEQPLLDLPDEDLATIAWLEQTFHPVSPKYREVQAFLRRLRSYLAGSRREYIEKQRTALVVDLGQRDDDRIDPEVEAALTLALSRRRQVEFDYFSPQNDDAKPRRHVVDFYEPAYFDTERGHYYVYGWCHYVVTPTGPFPINDYVSPYRLGRMRRLQILPNRLQSSPPPARQYEVKYWLSQKVARYGVTQRRWINIEQVEACDDGKIVSGTTPDLFFAVQELMHYRNECRVLGGPELLARMKEVVRRMGEVYES